MKSMLFVPADSERKLAKALGTEASVVILDLEDAVLPDRKPLARQMMAEVAKGWTGNSQFWVRVNDLTSGELLKDLVATMPHAPVGIVLPKIRGPEDVEIVSHYLDMAEAANGLTLGVTRLVPVCTETPSAVLRMGELLHRPHPRIAGLMWGGEDLSAAMGAGDPRFPDGSWRPTICHARSQCVMAAHALDVEAIDTVYIDFRDSEGCRRSTLAARHDGFTGKVAIHPDQVPVINAAFTPTADEIAQAQRIIAAFASGAGAVALDGKMLDVPHLKGARRVLANAGFGATA